MAELGDTKIYGDLKVNGNIISKNLQQIVSMSSNDIDWSLGGIYTKTISSNTTLTYSNLILNKSILLIMSGDYTLSFPTGSKILSGTYDGTVDNFIQLHCTNNSSTEVWISISQEI